MLFVKTRIGDEIVIKTPGGDIRLLIGGTDNRNRELGISAPVDFRIVIPSRGHRAPTPTLTLPAEPGGHADGRATMRNPTDADGVLTEKGRT